MDARSAPQAKRIMDVAAGSGTDVLDSFPELRVNSNGEGPISAEWLLPKALWIKEMEPEVWEQAHIICEYQDYLNYRLTNRIVASSCNAAVRWHHDGWEVLGRDSKEEHAGRPLKLYKALGISELASKLPKTTLAMGDVVGGLSEVAAKDLGLPEGTLVIQVSGSYVL
jgi:ribulose kinase